MNNPYEVLGVSETATDEEVKAVGVEWCKAQCKDLLAHGAPGLHFYTFMASDSVYKVAKEVY